MWPKSRNIASFTKNNGSKTVLHFITSSYFESVENELSQFETTIRKQTKALNVDIKTMVEHMDLFKKESQIDKHFVM